MWLLKRSSLKISSKVALSFVILVLLQGVVTWFSLTQIVSRSQNEVLRAQMTRTVSGIERYLQEVLNEQIINAELLAGQAKVINYTDFGLKNLLQRELSVYRSTLRMDSLSVYLETDRVFATVGEGYHISDALDERLRRAFGGSGTFFIDTVEEDARLSVLNPIERENEIIGVLNLSRKLDSDFVEKLEIFTGPVIVLTYNDKIVTSREFGGQTVNTIIAKAEPDLALHGMADVDGFIVGLISVGGIGESPARLFCLLDTAEYRKLISRYNLISLISTFVILSIAFVIAIVFYGVTFRKPFEQLMTGVYKISQGDLQYRFQVTAGDEFGDLSAAFDKMRVNLINREQEILQLSLYNSLILENVHASIITADLSRTITSFNPAAVRIFSADSASIVGTVITPELLSPHIVEMIDTGLQENSYGSGKEVVINRDGRDRVFSVSISPLMSRENRKIGIIAIMEEITQIKRLEERLSISSRLAALGEMAAGVAHQIRNPLGVMKVSAEMLRDDFSVLQNSGTFSRITNMIVSEIDTLSLVIDNLLDFARPREVRKTFCSIGEVIRRSLDSLPMDKFPDLEIEVTGLDEVPEYRMDKSLIEQVISNIVLNAIQASPPGGKVRISVISKNGRLQIEIRDWGSGFDKTTRNQIFNPFFTTKSNGTGLGLSIGHRIIEQHNGTIDVFSSPGEGSMFRITLQEMV